ncbi:hypothetical protein [Actinomycetospora atypica]|uniref:Uncharacterized protein n=1 Tax=Actinomycetospora atypica TaxID=1290095 RepID=A0ABV9YTL1_9PSEU
MNEEHRTSEQARSAARSVLANRECLDALDDHHRARAVGLAERLVHGHLDAPAILGTVRELRALLDPTSGLAARAVASWLDDLVAVRA